MLDHGVGKMTEKHLSLKINRIGNWVNFSKYFNANGAATGFLFKMVEWFDTLVIDGTEIRFGLYR